VFALQKDVANAVAEGIGLRLTAQQQGRGPTGQDFGTFDLYLRGRYYWNMRTPEGLRRSIQYFREAIDRDPGYALGYAGLADAYNLLAGYGVAPRDEALRQGSAAATRALDLDDGLAEAHASLAFIHDERREWEAAEAGFKRALDLKPGYAAAHHWYGNHLAQLGRFPQALVEINRAVTLDPFSVGANGALGSILLVARRYDEAIRQLEKTLQMDATFGMAHMVLAEADAQTGQFDRALVEINKAAGLPGGGAAAVRTDVGYILALAGRRGDARKVIDELIERSRNREEGASGGAAIVYAGMGDRDRTFDWLNRALLAGDPIVRDLKVDLRFDRLRSDPRFTKLLVDAGFPK
jgi:tetratricopeptide (TPR) repeat protein